MKKSHVTIYLAFLCLTLLSPCQSVANDKQEKHEMSRDDAFTLANTMADCAGFLEATSDFMYQNGDSTSGELYHNKYNGWLIAGVLVLVHTETVPKENAQPYVQERAKNAKLDSALTLRASLESGLKFFQENCAPYADLQSSLVEDARREMYSKKVD